MSDLYKQTNPADMAFTAKEVPGENQDSDASVELDKDNLTPLQREGLNKIVDHFAHRSSYINVDVIDSYFNQYNLTNSVLNSPEIQTLAKNLILECLGYNGGIGKALSVKQLVSFKERLNYTNPDEVVLKKIKDHIFSQGFDFKFLNLKDEEALVLLKNTFGIEFGTEEKKYVLAKFDNVLTEQIVEVAEFWKTLFDLDEIEILGIAKKRTISILSEFEIRGVISASAYVVYKAIELIEGFKLPANFIKTPEIQKIIINTIDVLLNVDAVTDDYNDSNTSEILKFKNFFLIGEEKFFQMIKSNVEDHLKNYRLSTAVEMIKSFNLEVLFQTPEFVSITKDIIIKSFQKQFYSSINFSNLLILIEDFKLPDKEILNILGENDNLLDTMCAYLDITTLKELCNYTKEYGKYLDWLKKNNLIWQFTLDEIKQAQQLNFNLFETHVLGKEELAKMTKTNSASEEKPFAIIGKLFKKSEKKESPNERDKKTFEKFSSAGANMELPDWQDKINITTPFQNGAEIFGYDKMFTYCSKPNLSRHDALHNFDKILLVFQSSGLSANIFFNNILSQVNKDGASYESGTANHELNNIANNINLDFQATIERAQQYTDITKLQQLLTELDDQNKIFSSWKNLKKYAEICQLLGKKELLDQLAGLKSENPTLANYVETLAFHSNINMKSVLQFWKEPEIFLGVSDNHTSVEVHDRKKPSNYIHIPNLDLSAENMRDALVEGDLDVLQAFKPLEIIYEFKNQRGGKILDSVKLALGSRKEGVIGKAQDVTKLFDELKKAFKEAKLDFMSFFRGEIEVSTELMEKIEELTFDSKFGLLQTDKNTVKNNRYRAKINLKSDPIGAVAGNDTACCMPFGSGKNNVYTFNPVCSLFTVQLEVEDGKWRTVAQSVLTKDKDVKKNVSILIAEIHKDEQKSISAVLSDDILLSGQATLACDNVEVAKNSFAQGKVLDDIETIYRDFFKEYLLRYAEVDNFDTNQVVIGLGYSDSLTNLPQIDNTFLPLAPVGYSDNYHSQVIQLIPHGVPASVKKSIIEFENRADKQDYLSNGDQTVTALTFEDSLAVAYLESKAYADNTTLIQSLHNMENALIAKDINNVSKKRANLSLKHTNREGRVDGYMLAYEGTTDQNISSSGRNATESKSIIYVSDIAADTSVKGIGREMMIAFLKLYKINYLDKGNSLPILVQAREKTSYIIIKNKLADYAKLAGIEDELEIQEIGTYESGNDVMHELLIKIKQ